MTTPAVSDALLVVLQLSDSFNEYWPLLARELGVPLLVRDPTADPEALPTHALAVVVAAGGAETDVGPLLGRIGLPASTPLVVAGASTSHRI
ncbi:MAG TPA: hypothetical protein VLD58_11395, partial [Gemmatimonadales bacterium]|nr:hypothetical protein [Gemmatimonadales bacterium]